MTEERWTLPESLEPYRRHLLEELMGMTIEDAMNATYSREDENYAQIFALRQQWRMLFSLWVNGCLNDDLS